MCWKRIASAASNMSKINKKVVLYSLIALVSLALMYFVNWLFIIPAALMVYLNQRELTKKE
jgi:hypothetical protein